MENNSNTKGRELRITRTLNAPVELVWEVWTNPEHIANRWGPNGFTNTISKMEVRQGGEWDLIMHGPDGTDYINKSVFEEVIHLKKLFTDTRRGPALLQPLNLRRRKNKPISAGICFLKPQNSLLKW
ncbi:MAG: SRPBCC domain-containing protein [Sphingobacteriales bacterium]